MKNIVLLFVFVFCIQVSAQRKPKIKGNKNVVEVAESLPPFHSILLDDDLEIILQKSTEEGYEIVADDNLISVLKFEVEGNTLVISSYYRITRKKELKITINYTAIGAITMNHGSILMKDIIPAEELTIETHGDSRLQLNANATKIDIDMYDDSSGDINVVGETLNTTISDDVEVRIYTISEVNTLKMIDNTKAKMEGTAHSFSMDLSGEADVNGELLEAETAVLNLEDSASATVNASKDFKLSSKGLSKAYLYGNAKISIIDFFGNAELHKRE